MIVNKLLQLNNAKRVLSLLRSIWESQRNMNILLELYCYVFEILQQKCQTANILPINRNSSKASFKPSVVNNDSHYLNSAEIQEGINQTHPGHDFSHTCSLHQHGCVICYSKVWLKILTAIVIIPLSEIMKTGITTQCNYNRLACRMT